MTTTNVWYYTVSGKQKGPVTFEELKRLAVVGKIDRKSTLVWSTGMSNWASASSVDGLFDPPLLPIVQNIQDPPRQERLDVDPTIQGLWRMIAISTDGFQTYTDSDEILCRVFGTKARMSDGTELTVERVIDTLDRNGNWVNIIFFTNETMWAITDFSDSRNLNRLCMQVFLKDRYGEYVEKVKMVILVEQ